MTTFKTLTIEDYEAEECVKPLFDSLIQRQVNPEILINLFFDTKIREYFEYLPPYIQNDEIFLWNALNHKMISYHKLPKSMQNADTITKSLYIDLLEEGLIHLNTNLYPQDLEITIASMKHSWGNLGTIEEKFKTNPNFIIAALAQDDQLWPRLSESSQQIVLENEQLLKQLIIMQPKYYIVLNSEQQISSTFLTLLLENHPNNYFLDSCLKKNKDPEIALLALKIDNKNIKKIHQNFSTIIKKFGAKADAYNFFKTYLLNEKINKIVPNKTDSTSKMKI